MEHDYIYDKKHYYSRISELYRWLDSGLKETKLGNRYYLIVDKIGRLYCYDNEEHKKVKVDDIIEYVKMDLYALKGE